MIGVTEQLKRKWERNYSMIKYFSTFTGIGGFELGIQNAYRATLGRSETHTAGADEAGQGLVSTPGQDTSSQNGRPSTSTTNGLDQRPLLVGYSEIDKHATAVFEKHFKGVKNYGDITKIKAEELPDFDCLVGGFPCQAFSIAGKRGGFDDTRGTLFFDLARILRAKQPRLFVFENVKGLLSHDSGRTFATIIATIDELGYDAQWQVLNSKNFGVPQNRERIIIVGHLRGTTRPQVFPITGADQEDTRIIGQDVAYTIDANYHKGTNTLAKSRRSIVQLNQPKHSNDRVYDESGISPTLNTMQGGVRQPFISQPPRIRRLTPLECERLQNFPDDWTKEGIDGVVSDTQRYKMAGNAVTTSVIQAVFEGIFNTVGDL